MKVISGVAVALRQNVEVQTPLEAGLQLHQQRRDLFDVDVRLNVAVHA
jgi:hypothetical protein